MKCARSARRPHCKGSFDPPAVSRLKTYRTRTVPRKIRAATNRSCGTPATGGCQCPLQGQRSACRRNSGCCKFLSLDHEMWRLLGCSLRRIRLVHHAPAASSGRQRTSRHVVAASPSSFCVSHHGPGPFPRPRDLMRIEGSFAADQAGTGGCFPHTRLDKERTRTCHGPMNAWSC